MLDELEARLAATLGRQADSLAQIASDVRLVVCQLDRAYAGRIGNVLLEDVRDPEGRARQAEALCERWREATNRLWIDAGDARLHEGGAMDRTRA